MPSSSVKSEAKDQADAMIPVPSPGIGCFPCVLYECNSSFEISYVSPNVSELMNLNNAGLVGSHAFSHDRVFRDDIAIVDERLKKLENACSASLVHRIIDDSGLCTWVAHSLSKDPTGDRDLWHGCIVPIPSEKRILDLDYDVVSRFIHKIGNHFQLLTLLISPLKKILPKSKELDVLEETVEKAIAIARAFADYSQKPNWATEISVSEAIVSAINARNFLFVEAGIILREDIEDAIKSVVVPGDPLLLESAIGNILENALEATERNGEITVHARLENWDRNKSSVIVLSISDTGCGIAQEDLSKVTMPFYSTKPDHDGLGLSMASRFIELHGGGVRVDSYLGKGTEVRVTIPVTR
jgi:hypothetical protein